MLSLTNVAQYNDFIFALCSFLDEFKRSDNKYEMIEHPPLEDGADRVNLCILAATAHKLANDHQIPVPKWVYGAQYRMPHPIFAFNTTNREYQEFLIEDTPYEFASKNIYHGANAIERV